MAVPSRTAGRSSPPLYYNGFSTLQHQGSFQWSSVPSSSSLHRLAPSSSEEYLQINEHPNGLSAVGITPESSGSSEQHSLIVAANNFVSAVTAMDKHVMIPNRLRDIRLPSAVPSLPHASGSMSSNGGERSRHSSGHSNGAGSMVGGVSLSSSDCSDPVAEGTTSNVGEDLLDTDMYSCYRLLNVIKDELLSSTNEERDNVSGESGDSDSDREGNAASVTPKEETIIFTAGAPAVDDSALSVALGADRSPITHSSGSCSEHNRLRGERRDNRRMTSASASLSLPASSTDAIRQRFRLHLNGLMSILSQLTETANVMTNYYDRCLIPGGMSTSSTATATLTTAGHSTSSLAHPSSGFGLSTAPSPSFSSGVDYPSGAQQSIHSDRSHIFQPARLF